MSVKENLQTITLTAAADLTTKQYHGVYIDSNGKAALSTDLSKTIGVLMNKPDTGQAAVIAIGGICKAVAGGSVTTGGLVSTNNSGKFVTTDSGQDWTTGMAMETGADGKIFSILIQPTGATT